MIDSGIQTFPPALLLGSKIYITCHETLATMGVCTELTREVPREALSIFHFSFPHAHGLPESLKGETTNYGAM